MKGRWGVVVVLLLLTLLVACDGGVEQPVPPPKDLPAPSEPPPTTSEPPTVSEPPAPEPLALTTYYLSDLLPERATNGHGPFEKDSSNGTDVGGDGFTLTINDKTYSKGLGVASPAKLVFDLGGDCAEFSAEVGIDDALHTTDTSIGFEVYTDEVKLWESGLLMAVNPFKATGKLTLTDAKQLTLVVADGGDSSKDDYGNWANAAITCHTAPPALADSDAATKGVFGGPWPWPTIPTHAALLPDSTILSWYSRDENGATRLADYNDQSKHNSTLVDSWNIYNNEHTHHDNMTTDLFCAGFAPTADGNLFVAGGNLGEKDGFYPGSRHTNLFDFESGLWSPGPEMSEGRWYPTVINLPNKEVLIMGGNANETTNINYIPDVWSPETNALRRLTGALVARCPERTGFLLRCLYRYGLPRHLRKR
jgi:NPCBM/NEW2 domain